MPDISMCNGGECPNKDECYRYRAYPKKHMQSYMTIPPFVQEGCSEFIEIDGRPIRKVDDIGHSSQTLFDEVY